MSDRIVIVGGGVAAARVSRSYRESGADGRADDAFGRAATFPTTAHRSRRACCVGRSSRMPCWSSRPPPTTSSRSTFASTHSVTAVDPSAGTVTVADGEEVGYDQLVLATGSTPRRLGIPGRGPRGRLLLPNPRRRARRPSRGQRDRPGAHRRRRLHRDGDRRLVAEPGSRGDGDRARRPALRRPRPSRAVERARAAVPRTGRRARSRRRGDGAQRRWRPPRPTRRRGRGDASRRASRSSASASTRQRSTSPMPESRSNAVRSWSTST